MLCFLFVPDHSIAKQEVEKEEEEEARDDQTTKPNPTPNKS